MIPSYDMIARGKRAFYLLRGNLIASILRMYIAEVVFPFYLINYVELLPGRRVGTLRTALDFCYISRLPNILERICRNLRIEDKDYGTDPRSFLNSHIRCYTCSMSI